MRNVAILSFTVLVAVSCISKDEERLSKTLKTARPEVPEIDGARKTLMSLKSLLAAGDPSAIVPFVIPEDTEVIRKFGRKELSQLLDGDIIDSALNGGRIEFRVKGNPHFGHLVFLFRDESYLFSPGMSLRYGYADPGPSDPLNSKVPIEDALVGLGKDGALFAVFDTDVGAIKCRLFEAEVPELIRHFASLARGLRFFRTSDGGWVKRPFFNDRNLSVVDRNNVILGDIDDGARPGGLGFQIPDQFNYKLRHSVPGRLGFATRVPNGIGGKIYFTTTQMPSLDDRAGVFGDCSGSLEVLNSIAKRKRHPNWKLEEPVKIQQVTLFRESLLD